MARAVTADKELGVSGTGDIDAVLSTIVMPGRGVNEWGQEVRRSPSTEPRADTVQRPTADGNQHPHCQPTTGLAPRIQPPRAQAQDP
jgi:hypothetical protein